MHDGAYTITIDNLAFGGSGVGRREDGKVVFVPHSIPGETLRVATTKDRGSYCEARLLEIIHSSEHRQKPRCEAFFSCGGCDWQHISYEKQIASKEQILLREMDKVFAKDSFAVLPSLISADDPYNYRCHSVLKCNLRSKVLLGYHQRKSHTIVEMDTCPIRVSSLNQVIEKLREEFSVNPIPSLQEIDLYAPAQEIFLLAHVQSSLKAGDQQMLKELANRVGLSGLLIMDNRKKLSKLVCGKENFEYQIHADGRVYNLSGGIGGFIQGNMRMNSLMVEAVLELVRGASLVLDLFSGCGNFSIPMTHEATQVVAVERDRRLAAMTEKNARDNKRENLESLCVDVNKHTQWSNKYPFDTIVIDPPREGAKAIMPILSSMQPKNIIYVSCNPTTLSRDLALLKPEGYQLKNIRLVDMFPQTYHIESIALLSKDIS